ncbi:MAG: ATP-dependent helicase [Sedimentisphaerales bacterium]|nr:ATP-dependent helicase [Sedimentisphaerales bacterium]
MEYQGLYSVIGPPGTGKTTFLASQVRKVVDSGYKPVVCSLTKTAAREIASRDLPIPDHFVGTLHSLAFRAIGHDRKLVNIKQWNEEHPEYPLSVVTAETDDLKVTSGTGNADELYEHLMLYRHRRTPKQLWSARVKAFNKVWSDWKFENEFLDFTDMIEDALERGVEPYGEPDIIIGDELQDFSRLEYELIRMWGIKAGALIGCGDGQQSLYQWRGADPTIFDDPMIPQDHRRILQQSYRIPRAVHRAAIKWVKRLSDYKPIEYQPRDFEGAVHRCPATTKEPSPAINLAEKYLSEGKSVMLMTTCSYMLKILLIRLRERAMLFCNPWRVANGGWNPLAMKKGTSMTDRVACLLKMDRRTDANPPWTAKEFWAWASVLKSGEIFLKGKKEKAQQIVAGFEKEVAWTVIQEFVDMEKLKQIGSLLFDGKATAALGWWQSRLRGTMIDRAKYPVAIVKKHGLEAYGKQPKLYVGTIHSFKGAEADVVFIFPSLSPQAHRAWCGEKRSGEKSPRDAIVRAFYVALTRAREQVYICQDASRMSVDL